MNPIFRRALIASLSLCLVGSILTGCSSEPSVINGSEKSRYPVTEGMYRYWMKSWKDYYVKNYSDVIDSAEYWQSMATDELTHEEYLTGEIRTRILYYYLAQPLFDSYDLSEKSFQKKVQFNLNSMVEYYGSKSACNAALDDLYGIDLSVLEQIYTYEERYTAVNDYLFGEKGALSANAEELDKYYNENYARAKYLLFPKSQRIRLDEDGKRVTDSSGHIVYDKLTEAEQKAVTEEVTKITADLTSDLAIEGYSDPMDYYMEKYMSLYYDQILTTYPNGFYITADEYTLHTATVTDAVFNMKDGEIQMVENEDCYFVIKKYPLIDRGYMSTVDSIQFSNMLSYCNSQKLAQFYSELAKTVEIDSSIAEQYTLSKI